MAEAVCSKCGVGWVIHSDDKYCGYCGCQIYDFSVRWKEEPLLYKGDGTDTRELTILVENDGACPITFQPIQTKREKAVQFLENYKQPFQVKAGQSHRIAVQVNPANLALHREVITVHTQETLPNLEGKKPLILHALARPDFKLTPSPVVLRYRKGTEKTMIELRVEVLESQFYINDIKFSPGWIRRVGFSKERHEKDRAMKSVYLEIDCKQLSDGLNSATLRFELCDFSQPIKQTIRVRAEVEPEPPRLFVPKMNLEVTHDRKKNSTLTLQNSGEKSLIVQDMTFNAPHGLVRLPNVSFPIKIEGGKHQNVDILISADAIKPATYPINFTITSNCEASRQYRDVLNVTVRPQEEYPYYLAIDFGTTNSCCAYIDDSVHDDPQLIPLDSKANPPEIMPSSIIYHTQPTEVPYHVGSAAKEIAPGGVDEYYYISSVKRWLGAAWTRLFPNNLKLKPHDVVADILKHIIDQAEKHLDTLSTKSTVTKCVITHPTMFSLKQQKDLKLAFKKIGITELILIDEASAASLGIISQFRKKRRKLEGNHRLLVYDFGGGTIDIVLSQVTSDGNHITIEPLASGGNPKYGGDDVTQVIVDFVLNEFKQRIRKVDSDLRFDIPYLKSRKILKSSGNPDIDSATRINTPFLYRNAEEMKRELSGKMETERGFALQVIIGNASHRLGSLTQGDMNVKLSRQQLQNLIEEELNKTFADIDTMIADNDARTPDLVVLAGQSSKMPTVKEMMETHFQANYKTDVNIHLDEQPKTCVVIGAAQYGLTRSSPTKDWIEIINPPKTHSRLGIMQVDGGKLVFSEIIPKGKLIPDESVGIMDFSLGALTAFIDVREHFGTDDGQLTPIDSYTLTLPEDVPRMALRKARLKMAIGVDDKIELTALVDGAEYKSTVKKTKPAFVDEI